MQPRGGRRRKLTRTSAPQSDVCEFNLRKRCQLKSTLVGYPYVLQGTETDGVLPANVNDACMADPKCSGWRWDATDADQAGKGFAFLRTMKKNEVDENAMDGLAVKAVHSS